jgi:hypothetical protein
VLTSRRISKETTASEDGEVNRHLTACGSNHMALLLQKDKLEIVIVKCFLLV